MIPAGYMVHTYSVQKSVFIAGVINFLGSFTRLGFWMYPNDLTFIICG